MLLLKRIHKNVISRGPAVDDRPPAFSVHLIVSGWYQFTVPAVSAVFDSNVT